MENRICPQCRTVNEPTFRYCKHCGLLLLMPDPSQPKTDKPIARTVQSGMKKVSIRQMSDQERTWISLHDPFAGYGQRGRFVPWFLSNLGDCAESLRDAVTKRFAERRIPDTKIIFSKLSGKGFLAEKREYYMIRRKETNIGVYISRFGKDLYISMVTYHKGAISPGRVLLAAIMIGFLLLIPTSAYFGILAQLNPLLTSNSPEHVSSIGLLQTLGIQQFFDDLQQSFQQFLLVMMLIGCVLWPLFFLDVIAVNLGLILSIYKSITSKDFWALLRTPPNEFHEDDINALERAVEDTVREALDSIGIDSRLMPPAPEGEWHKRLI